MHLQLDGRGPLHAQLTRALKTAVFAGRVHQGARLPATRQLARELGVSRNTVLAAYEQLRAEGFVDGRVGSGSYVTPPLQALRTMHAVNARWRRNPSSPAAAACTTTTCAFPAVASRACATPSSTACR